MVDLDSKIQVKDWCCQHIENFCTHLDDWEIHSLQLSCGQLDYAMTEVDLGGITLEWCRHKSKLLVQEAYLGNSDGLVFSFHVNGPPVTICHQQMDASVGLLWPLDTEISYVCPPGNESMIVAVSAETVDKMGWPGSPKSLATLPLPKRCRDGLVGVFATAKQIVDRTDQLDFIAPALKNRAVQAIDTLFADFTRQPTRFVLSGTHQRRANIVAAARALFQDQHMHTPGEIDAIAMSLGVSRRSLFRAFSESVGTSPLTYQRLRQLHMLRYALKSAAPGDATVTTIAHDHGFSHLGRLSGEYKRRFGESPRQTLALA